jgi:hypothetical protein
MYNKVGTLPTPLATQNELESLDTLVEEGDTNEKPYNVFIGHNLGHRVFSMSVPFRQFYEISEVANDRDAGPVAQRKLDEGHGKKLAAYMLKGLVSAAKLKRVANSKEVPEAFQQVISLLGDQPYFSLQPIVCNIRGIALGGTGANGIRGMRLVAANGETAGFRVFLSERHVLWVVDGQHRRYAADQVLKFLEQVRLSGKYPGKGAIVLKDKGKDVSEEDMLVWNEAFDAARSYATITVEVHLGLDIEQERQLFHDLNRLGKKVDASLAFQFDSSNPITHFIKDTLAGDLGIRLADAEVKDWSQDEGAVVLKDMVAINAIAFLNKSNIAGATPALIEPRQQAICDLWAKITEIAGFGEERAKEKTVAAQPVLLKALAKIAYDLNFSNRQPENAEELYHQFLEAIPDIDFSHENPMWRYYELSVEQRAEAGLASLAAYLPDDTSSANRDIGSAQTGFMRFGAKHNDIYPILADMIRWKAGLPSRRDS